MSHQQWTRLWTTPDFDRKHLWNGSSNRQAENYVINAMVKNPIIQSRDLDLWPMTLKFFVFQGSGKISTTQTNTMQSVATARTVTEWCRDICYIIQLGNATWVPENPRNPPVIKPANPGLCAGKNPGLTGLNSVSASTQYTAQKSVQKRKALNMWQNILNN